MPIFDWTSFWRDWQAALDRVKDESDRGRIRDILKKSDSPRHFLASLALQDLVDRRE